MQRSWWNAKTELKFSHRRMKPAGRSLTVLWSWFSSFKTDLETYIYITLQKAIYSLNAACLAAALVNLTPEPKPKNFLQPHEYVRATQEEAQGWTWLSLLCPQLKSLFRHPNSPGQYYILPYLRVPGRHESTDNNLSNPTRAKFLARKERKGNKKEKGRGESKP